MNGNILSLGDQIIAGFFSPLLGFKRFLSLSSMNCSICAFICFVLQMCGESSEWSFLPPPSLPLPCQAPIPPYPTSSLSAFKSCIFAVAFPAPSWDQSLTLRLGSCKWILDFSLGKRTRIGFEGFRKGAGGPLQRP